MTQEYSIKGMTCSGCVAKVKNALEQLSAVESAKIQLPAPQGILKLKKDIPLSTLQAAISAYPMERLASKKTIDPLPETSLHTYWPLILIVGFILGVTLLVQYPFTEFSAMLWMRHFMAGFFIVFAFFKFLNLRGFAESYQMYDIVAERWKSWGFIYPFVELSLGILYLLNLAPVTTSIITLIVLGVSSIGVIKSNLDRRKIKCACLGDVFNLPMSTVTIVEDLVMVAMAGLMLFLL